MLLSADEAAVICTPLMCIFIFKYNIYLFIKNGIAADQISFTFITFKQTNHFVDRARLASNKLFYKF